MEVIKEGTPLLSPTSAYVSAKALYPVMDGQRYCGAR
jgi:hypothetical protein